MSEATIRDAALQKAFEQGGASGAVARAVDWAKTPLGPVEGWPESLRAAAGLVLGHGFAMNIAWGPDLIQIYNDATAAIMGQKHPAAMGQAIRDTWAEIWDFLEPVLGQVWRSGRPTTIPSSRFLIERRGFLEEVYADITYSVVRDESGEVGGLLSTSIESTERVLGARRLRTLHSLASSAGSATTDEGACAGVMAALAESAHDVPFALLYLANGPSGDEARLAGSVNEGALDRVPPASILLGEEPAGDPRWPIARVLRSGVAERACLGRALALPVRRSAHEPSYGVLVAGLSPHLAFDDTYQGFLELVARDIAQSLAGVRALSEAREQAERTAEARVKETFLDVAAHELHTPLTSLKMRIQLATRQATETGVVDPEVLLNAHRAIERMGRLVDDLFNVAALKSHRLTLVRRPADLCELCKRVADEQGLGARRAVTLDLPAAPLLVEVDPHRMLQVITNLVANALKYSPADRPVLLSLQPREREVLLAVEDEGPGVEPALRDRIFERFFRAPGIAVQQGSQVGLGLGLYIVRTIIDEHGGRAWVEPRPAQGSRFCVALPLG
jgi:signal transduction histidine kinase